MATLHAKGWSIGDVAFRTATGRTWVVYCHRGADEIRVTGSTAAEAWSHACMSAQAKDC
jgi:hypothetical protein